MNPTIARRTSRPKAFFDALIPVLFVGVLAGICLVFFVAIPVGAFQPDERLAALEASAKQVAAVEAGDTVALDAPSGNTYRLTGEAGDGPWCLEMVKSNAWGQDLGQLHMTHEDTAAQEGPCPLVVEGPDARG